MQLVDKALKHISKKFFSIFRKVLPHLALVSLVFEQFIFVASFSNFAFPQTALAQTLPIAADGSTNTQITKTASGIDQVNIAAPNAGGLSHNKFNDYNVNQSGQVINNFSGKDSSQVVAGSGSQSITQTQIGGLVTVNSNLANSGSARVILNEVTSGNNTNLLGYTEIAGSGAELIIANPNGITCRGCGFINTSRLSVVAGSSNFDANGNLGFDLSASANPNLSIPLITIDGLGLDATRTSSTDIIASSIKLISNIYGSNSTAINLKTGDRKYNYSTNEVDSFATNSGANDAQLFAIDASALAKIQAGQIFIVATKSGFGVNMSGEIIASKNVNIDANGDVYYSKISASESANLKSSQTLRSIDSAASIVVPTLTIQAQEFRNLGSVSAYNLNILNSGSITNFGRLEASSLTISNIGNINNSGSIYGENLLSISGGNLTNSLSQNYSAAGSLSQSGSSGSIFSPQNYSIILTGLLTNSGLINSGANLSISSSGALTNSGEISAQNNLTITSSSSITNSSKILSSGDLNISGSALNNSASGIIASLTKSLTLTLSGNLQNNGELNSATDFTASAQNLTNYGKILSSANLILSSSGSFINSGILQSAVNTNITTSVFDNSGSIKSFHDATINTDSIINRADALIFVSNDLTLNSNVGSIRNEGEIYVSRNLNISSFGLTNLGQISAQNNFVLNNSAAQINNSGTLYAKTNFNINNSASLTNSGTIYSDGDLSMSATSVTNSASSLIHSAGNLSISASGALTNSGEISATNSASITSSSITNSNKILANNNLVINSSVLLNQLGGAIASINQSLTLNLSDSFQNLGAISSQNNLEINSQNNFSNSGNIIVGNNISISSQASLTNSGIIFSSGDGAFTANALSNSGTIQNLGNTQINLSGNFTNSVNSLINSGKVLSITSSGSLINSGEISSSDSATFNFSSLLNYGNILGNNALTINSSFVDNRSSATIASINSSLTLNLSNYVTNAGIISAKENLILANLANNSALNSVNNSGNISFQKLGNSASELKANNFTNSGNIFSQENLTLTSTNSFINSGVINSAQSFTLNLAALTNSGEISAQNNITITTAGNLTNSNKIISGGVLSLTANSLTNNIGAAIASLANSLTLTLNGNLQNSGEISSALNLNISSANFTNSGNILSSNNLTIAATNSVVNSGNLQSARDFSLSAASLDNSSAIKAFRNSTINASTIINRANALIFSSGDSVINSTSSITNSGSILSNHNLSFNAYYLTNSSEIFSNNDLQISDYDLTNSGSISSLGNLNIASTSSITNSNQILSGGNLSIGATLLSNSQVIQSNGNLVLNLQNLTNTHSIISSGSFTITASGAVSNSSALQSANDFTVNAGSFTNLASAIILAGADLKINASTIINQNTKPSSPSLTSGIVSSNGNVILRADTLNNNSGIITGKSTSLSALNNANVNLLNTLGAFVSTAAITLNLGNLDYTITGTITASNIDITANNITNLGNVTASDYIKLNATGNSGGGNGNITNGVATDGSGGVYNTNVVLQSGSYILLTANRFIQNYARISATTDLTLTSNYSEVKNYGSIQGGSGATVINATDSTNGIFTNYGAASTLTSNNNLIINAKDLNNFGEISAANDIATNISNNLMNNPTALIWSGRDSVFNVANTFTNSQADIYANRNLTIQKNNSSDASQNKTNVVWNISGNIETYNGDILIKAVTLNNQRSSFKTQHFTSSYGCWDYEHDWSCFGSSNSSFDGNMGLSGKVSSGRDLRIDANNFSNDASEIYSARNMIFNYSNSFTNNNRLYESYTQSMWNCWGGCNASTYFSYAYKSNYLSESYPAFIKSGGSLSITQNGYSNPSFINGNNVAQYAAVSGASAQSHSTTINHIDVYTLAQTGVVNVDLSSIISAINNSNSAQNKSNVGISNQSSDSGSHNISSQPVSDQSGSSQYQISGSSNVSGNADNSSSSSSNVGINNSSQNPSNIIFSGTFRINLDPAATTPLVESRSQFTDVSQFYGSVYYFNALGLDGNQLLRNIEQQTRQATNSMRILGDSFVESSLIKNQLLTLTNDSLFLSKSTTDSNTQIKELLDNSVSELTRLGLSAQSIAINGLTTSQANLLQKDIITFEKIQVGGISVLAPKIYLSLDTRNRLLGSDSSSSSPSLASSSAIFSKGDLTIDSPTATLLNTGSIVSSGNINMSLGSLVNRTNSTAQAQIVSGGNLTITSNNTLPNISGISLTNSLLNSGGKISIASNNDVSISNDQNFKISSFSLAPSSFSIMSSSSIKDDAVAARGALSFNAASDIQITSLGNINIANNYFNTGGSVFMNAANDINNSNYTIKASDNVVMSATNINNIATTVNNNETRIEAGNIVSLDATNDINNIGATIKAGNLAYLTAGNNINNLALVKYTIDGASTNSDGSAITESQALASGARNISSNLISKGNIQSDGNIVLVAGNDINNKGSNITSTGSSYIEATNGNINITTSQLRDKTFAEGGSKKKHWVSITDNITNVESNITSGGSLEVVASGTAPSVSATVSDIGNINIKGSSLESADNLSLTAKNDINIESAQDSSYSFAAGRTGKGKSFLNQSDSITQIGSDLTTTNNGNISITSGVGNTDIVGAKDASGNSISHGSIAITASKLTTKDVDGNALDNVGSGNIGLAAKEDLTISSGVNTKYSESFSSRKSTTIRQSSIDIRGSTNNVLSNLDSSGDISMTSGSDTNLIGTKLKSNDVTINSGGELNIYSVADTSYSYSAATKSRNISGIVNVVAPGLNAMLNVMSNPYFGALGSASANIHSMTDGNLSYSSNLNERQKLTNQLSSIEASGDINLTANTNLNLVGTKLTGSNSNLTSETGDVSIYNVVDKDYSRSESYSSRVTYASAATGIIQSVAAGVSDFFILMSPTTSLNPSEKNDKMKQNYEGSKDVPQKQEQHVKINSDETIISSSLNLNNLNINSGGDTNIRSSNLTTSGNLDIISGNNTNILTAIENDYSYSLDSKKTPTIAAAFSNSITKTFNDAIPSFGHDKNDNTQSNSQIKDLVYDQSKNKTENKTQTNIASNIDAVGDINITSQNNNLISGSNLSGNNINLTATNGSTIITSAQDQTSKSTETTSQDYNDFSLNYNRGRSSADSTSTVLEETTTTTSTTQRQSNITAANNINIISNRDLNILSSNLSAINGSTTLNSLQGNVNILALQNTETTSRETRSGTLTLSAGIGNSHVDTAYAEYDMLQATKNVADAKKELNHMETLRSNGEASDDAVEDAKINLAIASINLMLAELKLGAAAAKSAASANSLWTGFYGDLRLTIAGSKTNYNSSSAVSVASNVNSGGNIIINSGLNLLSSSPEILDGSKGNTTITGSNISSANGNINIASKNNTNISASKDTYNETTNTKSWESNITLSSSAGSGSATILDNAINALQLSLSLNMNKSKSDTNSTTYNNSELTASNGNITLTSIKDTNIIGANILSQNTTLNVGGNINLESLQNSYTNKSKSFGLNLGGSGGASGSGSGSASFGINYSSSKTDRLWTDNQTSIIGTNSVTINVGNNTNIKGAVIANSTNALIGEDAIDGGNLTLNTKSLTFQNLYDHYYTENRGVGFSTNIGTGINANEQNPVQRLNFYPNGSTTLSLQNGSSKKEQTTFATIGSGNVNITDGSDISSLNRDITKSQIITKDQITGALNVSVTIDNRLFTEKGREGIKEEQRNLGKNLATSLDAQNQLLLGILPTKSTEGGIIGQMIALIAGDQRNLKVEISEEAKLKIAEANKNKEGYQITTGENDERIITFKDGSTAIALVKKTDLDDLNENIMLELNHENLPDADGIIRYRAVSDINKNKDTSFNGILNLENNAIKNGLMQIGALQSNVLNVNYDPTHGFASDVLEAGWNWLFGKTPLKSGNMYELNAYGKNIADAAKTYDITGLRMVGHSEGGDRLYQGVLYAADKNQFKGVDLKVQFYGSPSNTENIQGAAGKSGLKSPQNIVHQINPGDYVGENLGWGNSQNYANKILGPFGPGLITNAYKLFSNSSPHSNYFCEGSFCGYDKLNINKNN